MKLLKLFGLLFVLILCVSVFSTEGRKHRSLCCSKTDKKFRKHLPGKPGQMNRLRKSCRCPPRKLSPLPMS